MQQHYLSILQPGTHNLLVHPLLQYARAIRLLKLGGCHDGCHAAQHTDLDALAQARQHDLRTSEIMLTSGGTNARTTCPFLRRPQRRRVDRTSALGLGLLERYVGPATPGHGPSSCRHVFIDKILVHHRTTPNLSWSPGQSKRCCETKTKVVQLAPQSFACKTVARLRPGVSVVLEAACCSMPEPSSPEAGGLPRWLPCCTAHRPGCTCPSSST